MLRIWGRANSTNVKKVLWCAEELGLQYERIDAGMEHGVVDEPRYRALNPNGLVPCLQDGDFVLWESNAIVRYLAGRHGTGTLMPRDERVRAQADKWMDWTSLSFSGPFRDVLWNLCRVPPDQRDAAAVERGAERCGQLMVIADAALRAQPYLSGEQFGMGDIPLGCIAYAWFAFPIERPAVPALARWYERLQQRPAYRKAVMIPLS